MTDTEQRQFGKYVLLDLIAKGGMAEVYRARLTGAEQFERILAIKCMRPEVCNDENFTDMFVTEARLAGQLNHPNIAQIYELGRFEDQLYIAMELVEGRDLNDIIIKARDRGRTITIPFAAHVIRQVAKGLDHAHRLTDPTGRPLGLIHRDVTPRNIIVSWQGTAKVVDFGIAKATAEASKTQIGTIKGKFNYLAPEQVHGLALDRRVDIFNLGNVLFELMSGQHLYAGNADFDILSKARDANIPNLEVVLPDAPPALIAVLKKTLAADRQDRYDWSSEVAKALEPFIIQEGTIFGDEEAASIMEDLFAEERGQEQERTRQALVSLAHLDPAREAALAGFAAKTETFMSAFDNCGDRTAVIKVPGFKPIGGSDAATRPLPTVASARQSQASAPSPTATHRWMPIPVIATVVMLSIIGGLGAFFFFGDHHDPTTITDKAAADGGGVANSPMAGPGTEGSGAVEAEVATEDAVLESGYLRIRLKRGRGAKLFLDDSEQPLGTAALKPIEVPVGVHVIRAERRGKTIEQTVEVQVAHTKKAPAKVNISF